MHPFSEKDASQLFSLYLGPEIEVQFHDVLLALAEKFDFLAIAVAVAADLLRTDFDPVEKAANALCLERLHNATHNVPDLMRIAYEKQSENPRALCPPTT